MLIELTVRGWDEAREWLADFRDYTFRGQSDANWSLETTLERSMPAGTPRDLWPYYEKQLVDNFKRRAHHYLASPPRDDRRFEWMSQLRHYGGPTRILDVTLSPYVAAYFAFEPLNKAENAAVWAFPNTPILMRAQSQLASLQLTTPADFQDWASMEGAIDVLLGEETGASLVIPAEPVRMNDRLVAQQGRFLVPCTLNKTFETCLFETVGSSGVEKVTYERGVKLPSDTTNVLKILLSRSQRTRVLDDLDKMNINAATLYPGLDGFARSLTTRLSRGGF